MKTIKVMINVHPQSSYAKYNGMLFTVEQFLPTAVCVSINGILTDLLNSEVIF